MVFLATMRRVAGYLQSGPALAGVATREYGTGKEVATCAKEAIISGMGRTAFVDTICISADVLSTWCLMNTLPHHILQAAVAQASFRTQVSQNVDAVPDHRQSPASQNLAESKQEVTFALRLIIPQQLRCHRANELLMWQGRHAHLQAKRRVVLRQTEELLKG